MNFLSQTLKTDRCIYKVALDQLGCCLVAIQHEVNCFMEQFRLTGKIRVRLNPLL